MAGFLTFDLLRTHEASFDTRRRIGVPGILGDRLDEAKRPRLLMTWEIGADGRPAGRWVMAETAPR